MFQCHSPKSSHPLPLPQRPKDCSTPYSILTPHFAEFERLAGKPSDDFDRLERAKTFAQRYSVILVLKGHHTVVTFPDGRQFFNTTGNAGMATAGSGDVLTGLILSLLAQGYSPEHSAVLGVYFHGAAGDAYAEHHDPRTLLASDLPNYFYYNEECRMYNENIP